MRTGRSGYAWARAEPVQQRAATRKAMMRTIVCAPIGEAELTWPEDLATSMADDAKELLA